MRHSFFLMIAIGMLSCGQTNSQKQNAQSNGTRQVGGQCEGCEAIYESPVPFNQLTAVDTLPDYDVPGPRLMVSGTVFQSDGKTPAGGIVLYVYHTDQKGIYPKRGNETGWAKRHGYIRGWVKTDQNGNYRFYTLKPAAYPGGNIPAHIHIMVKEPDKNEYWIDDFLFRDDPLLTMGEKKKLENRGGSGIIELVTAKGGLIGTRHIILGKNIPGYTAKPGKT